MNKSNLKYYIGIILILFMDSLHSILFNNNDKYDIYVFYNHSRFLTNILYDISNLVRFSIITYFLIKLNKTVFRPLFILSLFCWLSYFLVYNQIYGLALIPIYLIIVYLHNKNIFK